MGALGLLCTTVIGVLAGIWVSQLLGFREGGTVTVNKFFDVAGKELEEDLDSKAMLKPLKDGYFWLFLVLGIGLGAGIFGISIDYSCHRSPAAYVTFFILGVLVCLTGTVLAGFRVNQLQYKPKGESTEPMESLNNMPRLK